VTDVSAFNNRPTYFFGDYTRLGPVSRYVFKEARTSEDCWR